jgi:nucleoid DNA-binding protein
VNKGDLVAQVSAETGFSKRIVTLTIDAFLNAILRGIASGERVTIPGFGTFDRRLRAPRTARNPRTNTRVMVPATPVVVFRPGRELRDACRGRR